MHWNKAVAASIIMTVLAILMAISFGFGVADIVIYALFLLLVSEGTVLTFLA